MKKIIISCIFSLSMIGCFAQNANNAKVKTPEQRADHLTNWMTKAANLSNDQKTKVYAVNLKYAQTNQATKSADQNNRKQMWQDLKANENEREAELKGIMTTEQFQAYSIAKQQLVEKRRERKGRK